MKKIIALLLVIALTATVSVGLTAAYLTDRDSEANVFTMGNVEIDLTEDFEQGSELIPGVDIEKKPTITNTGDNDAWVWATIAIPAVLDDANDASKNIVHFNYNGDYVNETQWTWQDEDGWMVEEVEYDGVTYNVYTVLYQTALKPGETTPEVMTKVYMDTHIDIDPDGNLNWVENGTAAKLDWNINTNGNPVIYVSAYAIQTEGFATVQEAYDAYQTQWGENGTEWGSVSTGEGDIVLEEGKVTVVSGEVEAFSVSGSGTLVLDDVTVTAAAGGESALTIAAGSTVDIVIQGNSTLTGATGGDGIEVEEGATLNLSGSGSLTVVGNGGSEDVNSSSGGNGIGGAGDINISGLSNLTAEGYGKHAAGIGGESANITISDTTINNVQGGYVGQVGTDSKYYKDAPEGGPAIGSSTNGAVITLTNVNITSAEGGSKAAGIGGSYWTTVTVNIDGCTISNAVGGTTAAGIGGSRIASDGHNTTTININNSTINATGGVYGAGIGSGYDTNVHSYGEAPICTINITGTSVITAKGGQYAAGVGTGYHAGGLDGEIAASVTVNAASGEKLYKDSYTQAMDIGFGVLDPERDGKDNTCTITYQGEEIGVPSV